MQSKTWDTPEKIALFTENLIIRTKSYVVAIFKPSRFWTASAARRVVAINISQSNNQFISVVLLHPLEYGVSKCLQLLAQLPHTGTLRTYSRVSSTYGGRLCDARTKTSFWTVNRCSTDQLLGIGHYTIGYSILISVCILPRNWFDWIVFQ